MGCGMFRQVWGRQPSRREGSDSRTQGSEKAISAEADARRVSMGACGTCLIEASKVGRGGRRAAQESRIRASHVPSQNRWRIRCCSASRPGWAPSGSTDRLAVQNSPKQKSGEQKQEGALTCIDVADGLVRMWFVSKLTCMQIGSCDVTRVHRIADRYGELSMTMSRRTGRLFQGVVLGVAMCHFGCAAASRNSSASLSPNGDLFATLEEKDEQVSLAAEIRNTFAAELVQSQRIADEYENALMESRHIPPMPPDNPKRESPLKEPILGDAAAELEAEVSSAVRDNVTPLALRILTLAPIRIVRSNNITGPGTHSGWHMTTTVSINTDGRIFCKTRTWTNNYGFGFTGAVVVTLSDAAGNIITILPKQRYGVAAILFGTPSDRTNYWNARVSSRQRQAITGVSIHHFRDPSPPFKRLYENLKMTMRVADVVKDLIQPFK